MQRKDSWKPCWQSTLSEACAGAINLSACSAAGSRQLFLGDVQSGIKKFVALFNFLSQDVVLSPNR
jgi:hypothetical protein